MTECLITNSYLNSGHAIGVRDLLLSWFRSYLLDRRHRIVLDDYASEWLPMSLRVPQMSVLGPLLFALYINDVPDVIGEGDDSKYFRFIFTSSDQENLQADLNALYDRSITWGMDFNVRKCKVLRVARIQNVLEYQYHRDGEVLEVVKSEKDLRVWLMNNLSWNCHVDNISQRYKEC